MCETQNLSFVVKFTVELRQMSEAKSGDLVREMGSMMLGGDNHTDGPKPFGMGDGPLPPPSPMSNPGMMNNVMPPKPGFGNIGRGGFPPNQQQQRFGGMQQQQQPGFAPPFAPPNQPIRGPFNPQMMQQQQQQQQQSQQQAQNFLQLAVQAGLINQKLLQQPLTHQQVRD